MSITLINRFYSEVLAGGNLALVDEMVTDDFIDHELALPGQPPGKEGARFFASTIRTAFPDIAVKEAEPTLSDGNLEAAHVVMTGTHTGDLLGFAATGKTVEFGGTDIVRVQDGKIAEHWGSTDTMSLMQQIGALPE
ncbi:ester cyclase [Arthrobacter sp. MW3 TE3886]|uniref:ester cyclase n=1 Tax=Arthrobacter sp. MW3 TE3886 TaxID=3156254 RepID=UPI0035110756